MEMKIAILGKGNVGARLGQLFSAKDHDVVYGSRDPTRKSEKVYASDAPVVSYEQAVHLSDIVLIATPWTNDITLDLLKKIGNFSGKIIVDCTNPLAPDYMSNLIGHTTSAAEEIAAVVKPASVVKAFNTIFADIMEPGKQTFDGVKATGFYCGDDAAAKEIVKTLILDAGFEPVDAGSLRNARYLEPMAQLNIQIAYGQKGGTNVAFRYMRQHTT
jgi:8-hydroxy-5-deazaflavin:NADPH oxidoreductase